MRKIISYFKIVLIADSEVINGEKDININFNLNISNNKILYYHSNIFFILYKYI